MQDKTDNISAVQLNVNREKPHNDEAEMAVLGCMLTSSEAAAEALTSLRKLSHPFYRESHQIIFDAIATLELEMGGKQSVVDYLLLGNYLREQGQLELIGGISYLTMLAEHVPIAKNIESYIDLVKQNAIMRRMIDVCSDGVVRGYEATDAPRHVLDEVEQNILSISQFNEVRDFRPVDGLVDSVMAQYEKLIKGEGEELTGIKTGYSRLDDMIIGLKPGDIFVLAARPSVGKTALALNIASNMALRGKNPANPQGRLAIGIFSLEMTSEQLVSRMIQSEARVNLRRLQRHESLTRLEFEAFGEAADRLKNANVVIDDTGGINILELRAKARRMKNSHDISCLFIDYLQLISVDSGRNSNRENDVAKISGALKSLAKELEIPIVVLAQLNRAAEANKNELPKLSNLRESGAIEQDADVVALLHRDTAKQREISEGENNGLEAQLIIAKNRNGQVGIDKLYFQPQFTLYEEASEVADEDVPR